MGKQTSLDTRELIIKFHNEGKTLREIGLTIGRCHNTVKKIIDKYKKFQKLENRPKCGRPRKLNEVQIRSIVRNVKKNPVESAVKISKEISESSGTTVSASTIRRALHANGIHGRVPRRKPLISKTNQKRRLDFANKYKNKDISFWNNIIFSDESKFEIFGKRKPAKIWRTKNSEFAEQNLVSTVKHGGGSVMVWGCMAAGGVGNLVFIETTMNKMEYLNILKENLKPSVEKLRLDRGWIFQQDNDPKHTSKIVKEWLLYHTPKQLDHPPQSPDLNPIEHLWEHLDREIRKKEIRSKDSLKSAILEEWQKISREVTENLVNSMPRRLQAVIQANGKQTKY